MTEKKPSALQQPLTPSPALAAVISASQITRGGGGLKIWVYIKQHNLQNPQNKREIVADEKLKAVFDGKPAVSMFEMNKHDSPSISSKTGRGLGLSAAGLARLAPVRLRYLRPLAPEPKPDIR